MHTVTDARTLPAKAVGEEREREREREGREALTTMSGMLSYGVGPTYGLELSSPPRDGITAMHFAKAGGGGGDLLLVSSWDQMVRLYSVSSNTLRYTYDHKAPALDCCFVDNDKSVVSCGLDNW